MQTEFETKILEINVNEITFKLKSLGAKKIGEKSQKRLVYDFNPAREKSWIRLRNDGETSTLTVKEIHNDEIEGTKELEVTVDDFDTTNLILEKLGYTPKGYQENKRISYELEGTQIEIDFWPQIPPYIEIEGDSKEKVKAMVTKLGYKIEQTTSINTKEVYKKYGIDLDKVKDLRF